MCKQQYEGDIGSSSSQDDPVWKSLWSLQVPTAVKVFFWRAIQDILPSAFNLHRRHLLSSPVCSRCKLAYETTVHALWSCSKAKEIWLLTPFRDMVGRWRTGSMKDLFRYATSVLSKSELVSVLMISHRIWQAQNEEIFQS